VNGGMARREVMPFRGEECGAAFVKAPHESPLRGQGKARGSGLESGKARGSGLES